MVTTAILDSRESGINEALARKGAGFGVHATANFKNNGVKRAGYMLDSGRAISPVMYPTEELLASSDDELADRIIALDADADADTKDIDFTSMLQRDYILSHVMPRLYGAENRGDLDDLGRTYSEVEDLLIGYYVVIDQMSNEEGVSSISVTDPLIEKAEITPEELHEAALRNISEDYIVRSMSDVMSDFFGLGGVGEMGDIEMPELLIISNSKYVYGAAACLSKDVQDKLTEILGDEYVILPSSIHEVIAVPMGLASEISELAEMVSSINSNTVSAIDKLTDSVYQVKNGDFHKVA